MTRQPDSIDHFHAHLDVCEQCRNHPFNLCRKGYVLLVAAAAVSQPTGASLSISASKGVDAQ